MSEASTHTPERGVLAWAAANPVAGNLFALLLLIGGYLLGSQAKQEVFPEFTLDLVTVQVVYPGASPEEVEQGVVVAIEEAVRGLDGVKRISSVASEGVGVVRVELELGTNRSDALSDVEGAVGRITSLPADAERPIVNIAQNRNQNIEIVVYGEASEDEIRALANDLRDTLLQDPEITLAEVSGTRPVEISIDVPSAVLREHGLTLDTVARAVSDAAVDLPGGGLRTQAGEILVRTTERRDWAVEFADIVVKQSADGDVLRLGEIATIRDTYSETDVLALFNGQRAAKIQVYRVGDETPISVTDAVRAFVERIGPDLPDGISLALVNDRSQLFRDRVDLLMRNAAMGLVLVVLVLGLFLELKLALWVTLGIPISFLGAMMLLPSTGVSINMISLFAFILVLGIVVDDAIVVGDAIYEWQRKGMAPLEAAIRGVREVAKPVTFSVTTTMVAFLPLLFVPGFSGKLIKMVPTIVILVLFMSLIEGLLILPAHLAHTRPGFRGGLLGLVTRGQERFGRGFDTFARFGFGRVAKLALDYRYAVIALAFASLLAAFAWPASGRLRFTFLPRTEGDIVIASLELPYGTPASATEAIVRRMSTEAQRLLEESGGLEQVAFGVYSEVGVGSPFGDSSGGSHVGGVTAYLRPMSERPFTASQLAERWRAAVGEVPGVENLSFTFNIGPSGGDAVSVELSHPDVDVLEAAAADLGERIAAIEGAREVDDGVNLGKTQLDFTLLPAARSVGITPREMARQLRASFFGAEVLRQQRGRDEVRVFVRLPPEERDSEAVLDSLILRGPTGAEVLLRDGAHIERGRAYTSIVREEGRRILNVTADVDQTVTTGNEVNRVIREDVLPSLIASYPRLSAEFGGEQEEQAATLDALRRGMLLAILGMFGLMAVGLRSYIQPIVILIAVPFGFAGAIGGHIALGYDLSLMSMFGMVALAGVAVNDSIVLVDAVNTFRQSGMSIREAVFEAAVRRLRPVILTSATTFFGLAPMLSETSAQARFLIPMAISLAFGVLYATVITLLVVPSLYLVLDDVQRAAAWVGRLLGLGPEDEHGRAAAGDDEPGEVISAS